MNIGNIPKPNTSGFFTLSYKNGDKFTGQLDKGSINSFGIYQRSNGLSFEGDFGPKSNDKNIRLKGKLTFDNGKSIYEGEFLNGKFDGKGTLLNSNGDIYEGYFKNGLKEGEGLLLFSEGDKYIGSFSKNNFEGEGYLVIKDICEYKGYFKNGKQKDMVY